MPSAPRRVADRREAVPAGRGAGRLPPDIEGLRAVAILTVLAYHAGLPVRGGFVGVDIFFVISGFLITGLLVAELDRSGSISWIRFVGRRIRRLLPAAVLVLVTISAVSWFVVPGPAPAGHRRRRRGGRDLRRQLGLRAPGDRLPRLRRAAVARAALLVAGRRGAVLRHLAAAAHRARAGRAPAEPAGRGPGPRGAGGVVVRVVGVVLAHLAPPGLLHHDDPGLGARHRRPARRRARRPAPARRPRPAGRPPWAGPPSPRWSPSPLWLPQDIDWPGAWALLPTVPTAVLLWVGWQGPARGPVRVLGTAPMVWVGGLSYSIYLWHWPVIILGGWAAEALGATLPAWGLVALAARLGRAGVAVVAVRRVPDPPRAVAARPARAPCSPPGSPCRCVGVLAALPLFALRSPFTTTPPGRHPARRCRSSARPRCSRASPFTAGRRPGLGHARPAGRPGRTGPRPTSTAARCRRRRHRAGACTFGDPQGSTTVALVGDSKAMQWLPALEEAAATRAGGSSPTASPRAPSPTPRRPRRARPTRSATPGTPPSWTRCAPTRPTSSSPRGWRRAPGPAAAPARAAPRRGLRLALDDARGCRGARRRRRRQPASHPTTSTSAPPGTRPS